MHRRGSSWQARGGVRHHGLAGPTGSPWFSAGGLSQDRLAVATGRGTAHTFMAR